MHDAARTPIFDPLPGGRPGARIDLGALRSRRAGATGRIRPLTADTIAANADGAVRRDDHRGAGDGDALLDAVLASLESDKAEDIVRIDLHGKSSVADHMVVCSGRSTRQVTAIAEKLSERVKPLIGRGPRAEGMSQGDWVLIDVGDVIVHVFRPEVREFYQLEKMWLDPGADAASEKPRVN